MEEILASIRRIIADDEPEAPRVDLPEPPAAQVAAVAAVEKRTVVPAAIVAPPVVPVAEVHALRPFSVASAASGQAEVLDLAVALKSGEAEAIADIDFRDAPQVPNNPSAPEHTVVPLPEPPVAIVSTPVSIDPAPIQQATLAAAERLLSPATGAAVGAAFGSLSHTILNQNARTLEDLVSDMLRPMLKSWLDDNLPAIVEDLVRAEIERVSRGRP
jgi:cell pole-organizing protein PopZ